MGQLKKTTENYLNINHFNTNHSFIGMVNNALDTSIAEDTPEMRLINSLNTPKSNINLYLKLFKSGDEYWDRYLKNKVGIKNPVDDKEFFKIIFKHHQIFLASLNDEQMAILNVICKNTKITKIIDLLKFGNYPSYREKVKMIKNFEFTDFELIKLLFDFTSINNDVYIEKYSLDKRYDNASDIMLDILYLLNNTINIIRCVKMSYHKYEIISYKDSKAIKKRVPLKNIVETVSPNIFIAGRSNFIKTNLLYYLIILLDNAYLQDFSIDNIENLDEDEVNWLFETIFTFLPQEYDLNNELAKALLDAEYDSSVNTALSPIDSCGSFLISSDIFFNRKVLLPKSGVVILPNDDTLVESIYLKEKQKDGSNFLVIIVRYKDGVEKVNSISLDIETPLIARIYLKSEDVKLILQKKDGIIMPQSFLYIMDFFGIKDIEGSNLNQQLDENNIANSYSVISPTYWKYRTKNYIANGDTISKLGVVVKREFEIEVAPFLRKIQGEASIEAQEYAKVVGLNLEKGYTIVKPHTRLYNKAL